MKHRWISIACACVAWCVHALAQAGDARPSPASASSGSTRDANGPLLRVVIHSTQEPVANATVYWTPADTSRDALQLRALGPDHARGPWPAHTESLTTGDDGSVRLPFGERASQVVVFAHGRSASRAIMAGWRSSLKVELMDTVFARVVTETGEPVYGVPVSFSAARGLQRSDALGRVFFEFTRPSDGTDFPANYSFGVEMRCAEVIRLDLPSNSALERWWTLTVPVGGALRVHVPDALTVLGAARGRMTVTRLTWVSGRGRHPPSTSVPFADGAALVRDLPLGLDFDVAVQLDGLAFPLKQQVHGADAGEVEAVREFHLAERPIVALRLLDELGLPLARKKVEVSLGIARARDVVTDVQGKLYVLVDEPYVPGTERALWLQVEGEFDSRLDFSRDFPRGVSDLGDVQSGAGALVGEGRVVDSRGQPVAGAIIQPCFVAGYGDGQRSPRGDWAQTASRRDGSFRVIGTIEAADVEGLALEAVLRDRRSGTPRAIELGARGIELQLDGTGALRGVVHGPDRSAVLGTRARITPVTANDVVHELRLVPERNGDATIRFERLMPGKWELTLLAFDSDEPLFEPTAIVVESGQRHELEPIDLADAFHTIQIEIVDEAGARLDGVGMSTKVAGSLFLGLVDRRVTVDGRASARAGLRGVTLDFWLDGHASVRVRAVTRDVRVTLRKGFEIDVSLAGDESLAGSQEDQLGLEFELVRPDVASTVEAGTCVPLPLPVERRVSMRVPVAGDYRVRWTMGVGSRCHEFVGEDAVAGSVFLAPGTELVLTPPHGIVERTRAARNAAKKR